MSIIRILSFRGARLTILFAFSCFFLASLAMSQGPRVPSNLEFANMKLKLTEKARKQIQADVDALTKASWNGHNASAWKTDLIRINGFDERMQYGGEDRELGDRLVNVGLHGKQIRYSAIVVHLDHKRGYNTVESIAKNQAIRKNTQSKKVKWTEFGIIKAAQPSSSI